MLIFFRCEWFDYNGRWRVLGSKWTLGHLRKYFDKTGVDDYYLWQRIWSILVLTIIGDGRNFSRIESADKCFEFLGFDILVDENLKPNLLEVKLHFNMNKVSYKFGQNVIMCMTASEIVYLLFCWFQTNSFIQLFACQNRSQIFENPFLNLFMVENALNKWALTDVASASLFLLSRWTQIQAWDVTTSVTLMNKWRSQCCMKCLLYLACQTQGTSWKQENDEQAPCLFPAQETPLQRKVAWEKVRMNIYSSRLSTLDVVSLPCNSMFSTSQICSPPHISNSRLVKTANKFQTKSVFVQ